MLPREEDYEPLFDPATPEMVSEAESQIGHQLPKEYADLLGRVNGMNVVGDYWFPLTRIFEDMNMGELSIIFGIATDGADYSIGWAMQCLPFAERAPKNLVPFGLDLNDFFICFRYDGRSDPDVILCTDPGYGHRVDDPGTMVMPLAQSFREFVDSVEPVGTAGG